MGTAYGGYNLATGFGYPHNIFLEVLTETGFVGFIPFLLFLINLIRVIPKVFKRGWQYETAVYLFLFFFLNAQLSGNFPGNVFFFLFAGIIGGAAVTLPPLNQEKMFAVPQVAADRIGWRPLLIKTKQ
jgi:O-antigen ligase